jgi:hypothetical protein
MAKIKDEYYVEYVLDRQKESDDAAKPLREQWKELWQLYQNKQDWSNKASWQSKCFIPKIFMIVEAISAEIKKAVIHPKKLFKFELDDRQEQEAISQLNEQIIELEGPDPGAANMMGELKTQIQKIEDRIEIRRKRMVQREKAFKQELLNSNLANVYALMIKVALLLGIGVPKVLWDSRKKRAKFENVDVFNVSIDPSYMPFQEDRPGYLIERQVLDLARLRKLARAKGSKYKKTEVKKIEDDAKKLEKQSEEQTRRGQGQHNRAKRTVELLQYWGDVIDKDDEKIEENMLLVVANGKYLIRKQKNPFKHELPPYIPTMPIPYPHRGQAGISLVQPMAKLQYAYNNIINMWLDNLNFTVNKAFTYDPNKLQDPKAMTAIYPGKKIPVNGENAVNEIQVTPLKRDSFMVLSQIDREIQEGTRVTESVSGMGSKKKKTLGEIELNTAQSKGLFEVIGRDIEQNSLKQVLEMAYDLYSQFQRWEKREGNYNFIVGGLSLIITQQQLTERVGQALTMSLQSPQLAQITDIKDLWLRFLSVFNLQDAYEEPDTHGQNLRPDQVQAIQNKADQDAKQTVARMSPQQIMKATG